MFKNIIGNNEVKANLINSVQNNKVSHSYLFIGIEGIGKKLIATEFDTSNNPDFMIIEPDGNSIKIEQIRNLQKKIQEKPIISNSKVYIINDADKMTRRSTKLFIKNARRTSSICYNYINRNK